MDQAIQVIRKCWQDERISYSFESYSSDAMAMEPKSPQGGELPIWVGGMSDRALKRVAELGDGWLANAIVSEKTAKQSLATLNAYAEIAGRDPKTIGLQMMLDIPPQDERGKRFYQDLDQVRARAAQVQEWGFECASINATAIFQSGARSVEQIIDTLGTVHNALST